MTIRPPVRRRRGCCADATPACGEQHARPTSAAEQVVRLLTTWPGTLRLVLVLVVLAGLLVGVMLITPVELGAGPVQIAPAAPGR